MVGINVPIPVPMAYHSFGGWKASLFGDLHVHGRHGVRFYTRDKVVTRHWADPRPAAAWTWASPLRRAPRARTFVAPPQQGPVVRVQRGWPRPHAASGAGRQRGLALAPALTAPGAALARRDATDHFAVDVPLPHVGAARAGWATSKPVAVGRSFDLIGARWRAGARRGGAGAGAPPRALEPLAGPAQRAGPRPRPRRQGQRHRSGLDRRSAHLPAAHQGAAARAAAGTWSWRAGAGSTAPRPRGRPRPAGPPSSPAPEWGAASFKGTPGYGTVQMAYVHHTVSLNTYSKAESPAVVRGIQRYHQSSNGWSDIGYNFLVDRFGQSRGARRRRRPGRDRRRGPGVELRVHRHRIGGHAQLHRRDARGIRRHRLDHRAGSCRSTACPCRARLGSGLRAGRRTATRAAGSSSSSACPATATDARPAVPATPCTPSFRRCAPAPRARASKPA